MSIADQRVTSRHTNAESGVSSAVAAYLDGRRRDMVARLHRAADLAPLAVTTAALGNFLVFPDRLSERLASFGLSLGLCFGLSRVLERGAAARFAVGIAAAFVMSLAAVMLWSLSLSPAHLDVLVGTVVALMVGSALLFPWGPLVQTAVSGGIALGYTAVLLWFGPDGTPTHLVNVCLSVWVGVGLSVAGAWMLDHQRRRNAALVDDLERAHRLKSEFVSTMSHELRTPLNVIIGYVEMLREMELCEDERRTFVGKIDAAAAELYELIEDTLDISRLEAGRDDPKLEQIELPAFLQRVAEGCRRIPCKPAVTLEWPADVPNVRLTTDPRKVTVVLRNLVSNALKFTETGYVRVSATADAEWVVLRIADSGMGIPSSEQEAIFEMFRQADGSDARRFGGVGLGLYIVRRFVTQVGGTIELDSEPGRGSTFAVRLPAGRRRVAAAA